MLKSNRLFTYAVIGLAVVGCSSSENGQPEEAGTDVTEASAQADGARTELANPADTGTDESASQVGADNTTPQAPHGTASIIDPASNLTGDTTREFMDILEVTVKSDEDHFVFEMLTAAPFPDPSEMTDGKRFDLIWFVDIDQNRSTGQGDGGNDYNIHLFLKESGWEVAWHKVSSIAENDGISIQPDEFKIDVDGRRASFTFPKRYFPSDSFEIWASGFTGNAWPSRTDQPQTARAVFDF